MVISHQYRSTVKLLSIDRPNLMVYSVIAITLRPRTQPKRAIRSLLSNPSVIAFQGLLVALAAPTRRSISSAS